MSDTLVHDEVVRASEAIMVVAEDHPEHRWSSSELRIATSYGGNHGALGLALVELIDAGRLVQDKHDKLIALPEHP